MIRKWFVLLAVVVCLAELSACEQMPDDSAVTSETNGTFVSETEQTPSANKYTDMTSDELYMQVHNRNIKHEDVPLYQAFRDDVVNKMSEVIGTPITWDDLKLFVRDQPEMERYPYSISLQASPDYISIIEAGIVAAVHDGQTLYYIEWSDEYRLHGQYSPNDGLIFTPQNECINRTALNAVISQHDALTNYQIRYQDIELQQNIIYVPLYKEAVRATAEVQINDDLSYTLLSVEFFDDDPDGYEFENRFGSFDVDAKETIVPDFLTEEQQLLYRRARNIYSHLFGGSPDLAEYSETLDYTVGNYDRFEKDGGWTYLISQGRYQNWDDFMSLVLSAFTEDFFDNKNRTASDFPRFVEYNGKLAFPDVARGGGLYYNSNFQDEFELISLNDTEIVFNVIGHYSYLYPHDGESFEERDARCAAGWDMTDKFTLRMVLTEDGWRFDEFYHPAIDERSDILRNILTPRLNATENTASPLQFSFTAVDDAYYFSFGLLDGSTKMIEVPNTETELYVLVMDGKFALYLPEKTEYGIMLPGRAFADYGHGQNISLDSLISAGCKAEIVELDSNPFLGYTLNAIVVETDSADAQYTEDDARSIIYNEIKSQYEALVQEIALGGEITLTHSDDRLQAILDDAESYCASQVEYTGCFGRYYVFTGSRFGYPIYFNKYTGEIFSDNTANTISAVNFKKGIYSLGGLYW